nr:immunoglobulin heavy chain junction region [Mus musculus]
CARGFAYW